MLREEFEIMAPVGSRDSLTAAIQAGADSIYFGIERLNMRAGSASAFTIDDLREIAETCRRHGIKSYLTVNTIIYDEDIELMHQIVDAAREAGISAIIASDIAVMQYCRNRVECRDENAEYATAISEGRVENVEFATAIPSAEGTAVANSTLYTLNSKPAVANSTLYTLHSETASTPYTLNNKPIEVHLSTQLNISNVEALRFYAQFADVVVLARELNVGQVERIHRAIVEEHICGPSGRPVRIEMFCHGALCMAVSGKCYMSLHAANRSANRGECIQVCRRSYTATDNETGYQLEIDNKYIMSPKDLKTIRFIDRLMRAGVRVFKIEGRARGPEYVYTVVKCYREAIDAVIHDAVNPDAEPLFTKARKDEWDERLARVFNRGFWDGYYQGQLMGEWNKEYGSCATERKVYVGRGVKYFSRIGVAEFTVEATTFSVGDRLLVTGPTTGAMYLTATEIHDNDGRPVQTAPQGQRVAIPVTAKIRPSDKLFRLDPVNLHYSR